MNSARLICPLCNDTVDRLVYRHHYDSERAIVEKIKKQHPGWAERDGACSRCVDYYHAEIIVQQRILPELGPHFPVKSPDDFIVLPTGLRLDVDPRFTGKGVTICFIDSGFHLHPDLTWINNRVKAIVDITNPEANPLDGCRDHMWHGTMTSVVCAGDGFMSNGLYKGIASDAELVLLKTQDNEGKISTNHIARALEWVAQHHEKYNIRVINMSLSGEEDSSYSTSPIDRLAEQLIDIGITIVAAVGNDQNGTIKPPANSKRVISVGGIDDSNSLQNGNRKMYHSTFGTTIDGFMKPELVAHAIWIATPILPGTIEQQESFALHELLKCTESEFPAKLKDFEFTIKIDSAKIQTDEPSQLREAIINRIQEAKFISPHYMHVDGTSFAAPIISAVIAQLLEINPRLQPSGIREILLSTSTRIDGIPSERQGFGLVHPRKAVTRALRTKNITKEYQSPEVDQKRRTIGFYLQHEQASQVSLAGSFNHWSRDILLMQPAENGVWKIEIPILPEGKYHYKFLIDEKEWLEDVDNPYREPDGFSGFNSVLFIGKN